MVGHYPTNKLIGRGLIPHQKNLSTTHTKAWSYAVLDPVSQAYPTVQGRSPTCYSPVRHSSTSASRGLSVRLACVKHAASVRPEPGSNSPQKINAAEHHNPTQRLWQPSQKNYQTNNQPPHHNQRGKTSMKAGQKEQTKWHTIEFSHNTTHTHQPLKQAESKVQARRSLPPQTKSSKPLHLKLSPPRTGINLPATSRRLV